MHPQSNCHHTSTCITTRHRHPRSTTTTGINQDLSQHFCGRLNLSRRTRSNEPNEDARSKYKTHQVVSGREQKSRRPHFSLFVEVKGRIRRECHVSRTPNERCTIPPRAFIIANSVVVQRKLVESLFVSSHFSVELTPMIISTS